MYFLVAGDYFTQWMEAYDIPNQEAVTVEQKWWMNSFAISLPLSGLDQGCQFKSSEIKEICWSRTLESMLATCVNTLFSGKKKVCFVYNTVIKPLLDFHHITICLAGKQRN